MVTLKGRAVARFDVDADRVRIGRNPENEVQIESRSVSRCHCLLARDPADGDWTVEDQGSHNGTYLNGARLEQRAPLRSGDSLGVGQFIVTVRMDSPSESGAHAAGAISVRSRGAPERRERLAPEKAHLLVVGAAEPYLLLDRDLLQVGSGPGLDLHAPGPLKRALIVRGYGGFQLVRTAEDELLLNGRPLACRAWLEDGDRVVAGALGFTFWRGLPAEEGQSTLAMDRPRFTPPGGGEAILRPGGPA